jgi:hypothetical protein
MGVEILSMKLDFLGGFSLASRLELAAWTSRCVLPQRSMLQQLSTCLTTKRQRLRSHRLSSRTKNLCVVSLALQKTFSKLDLIARVKCRSAHAWSPTFQRRLEAPFAPLIGLRWVGLPRAVTASCTSPTGATVLLRQAAAHPRLAGWLAGRVAAGG